MPRTLGNIAEENHFVMENLVASDVGHQDAANCINNLYTDSDFSTSETAVRRWRKANGWTAAAPEVSSSATQPEEKPVYTEEHLSEPDLEARLNEAQSANARLFKALSKSKERAEGLINAVYIAARDAAASVPPVSPVKAPTKDRRAKREEVALWHTTDWQMAKETVSYSTEICERRVKEYVAKAQEITEVMRADHPVKHGIVLMTGDMLEGVGIFPAQEYEIDAPLYEQIFQTAALEEWVVREALKTYETVDVICEWGNHGRIGKRSDGFKPSDNVDRIIYGIVRERFKNEDRIRNFQVSDAWYQHFSVGNYSAIAIHGDEIKSFGGNCVTPDVRVLTRDLRWVPAGDLQVGDHLLAFDEHADPVRRYQDATVTDTGRHVRDVWKITFADGTSVRCTPEHPWIVSQTDRDRGGVNRQVWMTPPEIKARLAIGGRSHQGAGVWMVQPVSPWDAPSNDYASGLLAGAFDADGSLPNNGHPRWPNAQFGQYPNELLDEVKLALDEKGFAYKERTKTVRNGKRGDISDLQLGRDDTLRFLGQIRPARLLSKWTSVDVNRLTFTRKSSAGMKQIVSCEPAGQAEICALTSSSATYITEFGPAHNTPSYGILRKANAWASGVVEPFNDMYLGHYHQSMQLSMANGGNVYMSGSVESGNEYAREFVAATNQPSQRVNFINPEKGFVTYESRIWLT